MGFWIFMLVMDLLLPFTMIKYGRCFYKKAPDEINESFGYRTSMSMKNRDTWEFAHKYFGRLFLTCGIILVPISIIPMVFVVEESVDKINYRGLFICILQLVIMLATIIPVEMALKRTFDKNGKRR